MRVMLRLIFKFHTLTNMFAQSRYDISSLEKYHNVTPTVGDMLANVWLLILHLATAGYYSGIILISR